MHVWNFGCFQALKQATSVARHSIQSSIRCHAKHFIFSLFSACLRFFSRYDRIKWQTRPRPATKGWANGRLLPAKVSKTCLVARYNKLQSLCPPENIGCLRPIRGCWHDWNLLFFYWLVSFTNLLKYVSISKKEVKPYRWFKYLKRDAKDIFFQKYAKSKFVPRKMVSNISVTFHISAGYPSFVANQSGFIKLLCVSPSFYKRSPNFYYALLNLLWVNKLFLGVTKLFRGPPNFFRTGPGN